MCIVQRTDIFYLNITMQVPLIGIQFKHVISSSRFKDRSVGSGAPFRLGPRATAPSAYPLIRHWQQAMDCKRGDFVSIRHNEIHDLEAAMLSEVCKDVSTEPPHFKGTQSPT